MQKRHFGIGLLLVFSVWVLGLIWTPPANAFTEDEKIFLQAWRIVNQSYLDETFNHQNWWMLRQNLIKKRFDDREEAYQAIETLLATLEDPFTRLLRPEQYRSLQVSTSGELSGVGLQINIDTQTGQLVVVAPIDGSPAAEAGIRTGDIILAIDGVPTEKLSLDEAALRMRGKIGSSVQLTIERPGEETQEITLKRDRITLNPVVAKLDQKVGQEPIGYIRLSQFSANAPKELGRAVVQLENSGAKGFILDLRNNPGGLLQAGIEISRLWLNDSTIVYTVNRQGTLDNFYATHNAITQAPLVVLVNQGTASASEILAGALQDNHRAILVGEKTFGKGLIQSLFELSDDSGLAVTVAKYETPNHKDINHQGITPDKIVPQEAILLSDVGTPLDRQYQTAIELLTKTLSEET